MRITQQSVKVLTMTDEERGKLLEIIRSASLDKPVVKEVSSNLFIMVNIVQTPFESTAVVPPGNKSRVYAKA